VSGHHLEEGFAGAQRCDVVRRHRANTPSLDEIAVGSCDRRSAEQYAPSLLVLGRALSEHQAHGGILGNLLRQIAIDAGQIGDALCGNDARHASFARASQEWRNVSAFTSESGELVDDDEAWRRSLGRNAHEIEQNPGTNSGGERRVTCGVEAEENRPVVANRVFECETLAEVWSGGAFEHDAESRSESGDAFALDVTQGLHLGHECLGFWVGTARAE
jgi:hypothetical protein